jgi:L-seryl-tRNA(Ser) seleniumtransferase
VPDRLNRLGSEKVVGDIQPRNGTIPVSLRDLPQVQRLLERPDTQALIRAASRQAVTDALRHILDMVRQELRDPSSVAGGADPAAIVARAAALLAADARAFLRRAINATGIILHTNLGRAPLARVALDAISETASGYATLEFDDNNGRRGPRTEGVEALICHLTGAEAALPVNNNAAAVLLALSGSASGGEVIVSRGELVEIGGGFRIPDVIVQGGARLVEVGTTNRTRIADYRAAITPQTRALLKVHPSNYRIVGFTAAPSLEELASLAGEHGLMLIEDLGSGTLIDLRTLGRPYEPTVTASITAGVDLVTFSGDKLLGGPQCGILAGRARAIDPLRRHPLLRALRIDKLSLAALEATLRLYNDGDAAVRDLPTLRMLAQNEKGLQARAEALCALLPPGVLCAIVVSEGYAGAGSLPTNGFASRAVSISVHGLDTVALSRAMRQHRPAVVGRIEGGRFLLDMLAVADSELDAIADAVGAACVIPR